MEQPSIQQILDYSAGSQFKYSLAWMRDENDARGLIRWVGRNKIASKSNPGPRNIRLLKVLRNGDYVKTLARTDL